MSTLPEWWTVPYPEVASPETAAEYVNRLGGSLSRTQDNGSWVLSTGTQELLRTGSPEEVDSFVLGFALAHLICERHGPIGRTEPAATAAPVPAPEPESQEPGYEFAPEPESESVFAPPAPEPAVTVAEIDPEPATPAAATLSVVPDAVDDDDDEPADESDDGEEATSTPGGGGGLSASARRRRRRK